MASARYPLFISYYTNGTAYEERAGVLAKSLDRFGLDHRIEGLQSRGSWVENCSLKAEFIRQIWHEESRPICWLDADAEVMRLPAFAENFDQDFGVVARGGYKFSGGQVMFGRSPAAKCFVDRWADYAIAYPQIWDQVTLGYVWWELALEEDRAVNWFADSVMTKASKLPILVPLQKRLTKASIFHGQESRSSKKSIGDQLRRSGEFASRDIPQWWRVAARARAPHKLSEEQISQLGMTQGLPARQHVS